MFPLQHPIAGGLVEVSAPMHPSTSDSSMRPAPCRRRAAQAAQDGASPAIRAAHDAAAGVPGPAWQLHGAPRRALGPAAPPAAPSRRSSPERPTTAGCGAYSCTVALRCAACWSSRGCHHRLGAMEWTNPGLLRSTVTMWFGDQQSPAVTDLNSRIFLWVLVSVAILSGSLTRA